MTPRACESCRIRKVKCTGGQPCTQCAQFGLPCAVTQERTKRGNPVRGRLIARARGDSIDDVESGAGCRPPAATLSPPRPVAGSTAFSRDYFIAMLPDFEQLVYPFNPVICPEDLYQTILTMDDGLENRALVFAFASATLFLVMDATCWGASAGSRSKTQMDVLMQHSLDAHKRLDDMTAEEPPVTIKRVVTCIFLEISMMAFRCHTRSFSLLREAITMLQIMQVRNPALVRGFQARRDAVTSPGTSSDCSGLDTARYQRLYWEAFIHERFLTLVAGYPSILPPLGGDDADPTYPQLLPDPTVPAHIALGFGRLIKLFLVIDQPFLAYWAQQGQHQPQLSSEDAALAVEWIEAKQSQLDADEEQVQQAQAQQQTAFAALTELQHADLFVTRLWLRIVVWQVALSLGLLRSDPTAYHHNVHEGLSLHFPAQRLSLQLRLLVSRLESVASIGQQGSGIVQKLFEITTTIADVLMLPKSAQGEQQTQTEERSQVADFFFLAQFISQLGRIRDDQKAYLRDKVDTLKAQYGLSDV